MLSSSERWRHRATIAAGASIAVSFPVLILALSRLFGEDSWVKFDGANAVFLVVVVPALMATARCVAMILRLRSHTSKGMKRGLALAIGGAPLFFVSVALSIVITWGTAWALLAGLFLLVQVAVVHSAQNAYNSLPPEPGDEGMLRRAHYRCWPGWLWLLFVLFYMLSGVSRSVMAFDEATARTTLGILNTAEHTYASSRGSGFTATLAQLCSPENGQKPTLNSADMPDAIYCGAVRGGTPTTFTREGYRFAYVPNGHSGQIASYTIHADPIKRGVSGGRSFFTDESSIIRSNAINPAAASDDPN